MPTLHPNSPPLPAVSTEPPAGRARFGGLWIPLVTPLRDGRVDHDALAALTRSLAATGIRGFVVCGSTGEAASLDPDEQLACLHTVAAHAHGLPLVMGVSGYHLGRMMERMKELSRLAAAELPSLCAVLLPAPHYVRPSQAGLRDWFETLADASGLPLIVYDIPYRTGATLARETLLALAAHPHIRAVKDCGGDSGKTLALLADGRLEVLAGEDLQIFSHLAQGAVGAIAASAHLCTAYFVQMMQALQAGRLDEARQRWLKLVPLVEAAFAEPNPAAIKAWLAQEGRMANELRAPMAVASAALAQRLEGLRNAA
ncbi:MAG: 4-hydroxy-tetrahydrodipicolinate synthase [Burkholderiaceae bacterium]|nr:4-hydroxy-tetrahydrodipicolinate synthase [Burkholderiaceae bacterium]